MEFQLVEVKLLSSDPRVLEVGKTESCLSLRLEAYNNSIRYTIHAVVPYDFAGLKPPRIGDEFVFDMKI